MMMMGGMGGSGSSMGSMSGSGNSMGMMNMPMDPMMSMGGQMMYPAGYGMAPGYANGMMGGSQGVAAGTHGAAPGVLGFDLVSLLTGLLNFAINIFVILLVVGLIVGGVVFLKRYLFDGNGEFAGILAPKAKIACTKCGRILQTEWNCCPQCGEAKVTLQSPNNQPQTI